MPGALRALVLLSLGGLLAGSASGAPTFEPFPATTSASEAAARIAQFVEHSGDGSCGTDARSPLPAGLSRGAVEQHVRPYLVPTTPPGQLYDALDLVEAYEASALVAPLRALYETGSLSPDLAATVLATMAPLADADQRAWIAATSRALVASVPAVELGASAGGALLILAWTAGDDALLAVLEARAREWLAQSRALGADLGSAGIPYRKVDDWVRGKLPATRWLLEQRALVLRRPPGPRIEAWVDLYVGWNRTERALVAWSAHELRRTATLDPGARAVVVEAFRASLAAPTADPVARARAIEGIRYFGGLVSDTERAIEAEAVAASPQGIVHQLTNRWVFPDGG